MAKFNCSVVSYTLRRTVDITVIIPSVTIPMIFRGKDLNHKPEHKFPVLYLLHGMGNDHNAWSSYSNVEFYAEERNIAVVMISGENMDYIDHNDEASANKLQFYTFINKELPEFICGYFPISERPEDTYIAGLSMGGWGAIVHALGNPERYAAFGAFSAAVKVDNPYKEFYPPEEMAKKIREEGKKFPKAFLACGNKDFLYEANVHFRDVLIEQGADVTWTEADGLGHEWRFWMSIIEPFLDWLPRTDAYADVRRPM